LTGDGVRVDAESRPELSSGIVDFIAPAEYMVRPPMAPAYLFVVDVSYYAVYSGMVVSMIKGIREALQYLPGGERTKFGFITYDSAVTL
jgi:protein transport protein SEC24